MGRGGVRKKKIFVVFTQSFKEDPFTALRHVQTFLNVSEFDFRKIAFHVDGTGLWAVSKKSKAVRERKPENYEAMHKYQHTSFYWGYTWFNPVWKNMQ